MKCRRYGLGTWRKRDVAKVESAEHPESGMTSELRTLVELSRTLGEPSRDLVFVPYMDPGLTLARAVQQEMLRQNEPDGARRVL